MKTLILLVGNQILMHLVTTCRSPRLSLMTLIIRATAIPCLTQVTTPATTVWEHRVVIVIVDYIFVSHVLNDYWCSARVW